MALVKFYRGVAGKYNSTTHADGIYFATDSHELFVNGAHYGLSTADEAKLDKIAEQAQVNVIESILVKHSGSGSATALTPNDAKGVTIDLSTIETNIAALQADVEGLTGGESGSGSISTQLKTLEDKLTLVDNKIIDRLNVIEGKEEGSIKKAVADEATRAKQAEQANTDAITVLNEGASVKGSVAYAVAQEATARNTAIEGVQSQINTITGDENTTGSINAGIKTAKAYTDTVVDALDYTDAASGVVTVVNQENGKIAVTHAALTSADSTIKVDGLDLVVNIDGVTIQKDSTSGVLSVAPQALTQYTGENAIEVTGNESGKTISLKIKDGDNFLSNGSDGLFSNIDLTWNKTDGLQLVGKNGAVATIPASDFIKDGMLESVEFNEAGDTLVFTFNAESEKTAIELPVRSLMDVYEGSSTINVNDKVISVVVDPSSEYLTAGDNGLLVSGIDDAIDTKVSTEKTRAEGVENTLTANLTAEVSRAESAENTIEYSVGLNTDGSYHDTEKENAIHRGATTVMGAIDLLDEAVRSNNTSISTLNGEANVEGSVKKAVAEALSQANAYTNAALEWEEVN